MFARADVSWTSVKEDDPERELEPEHQKQECHQNWLVRPTISSGQPH